MKKVFLISLAVVLAVSMAVVGCEPPDDDEPLTPEEFYSGRQLELYTGPAGGSLTVGSELLMEHFAEATGATVVPLYHDALGGIESFNKGYEEAPRDGSAFMGFGMETVFTNALLEEPGVRYEIDELIWLGSILGTPMALWTEAAGNYSTVAALQAGEDLLQAGASRLGFMAFWGTVAGYFLDLDFQTVIGVGSPAMCKTSILAGDTHFLNVPVHHPGSPPELLPVVLIDDERHESFYTDVPAITEVVSLNATEQVWLAMAKVAAHYTAAGLAFPPDVPQDRVDYVRGVLNDIAESDAFIADWMAMMGYWDGWHTGADVEASYILYSDNVEDFQAIYALVDSYYITL